MWFVHRAHKAMRGAGVANCGAHVAPLLGCRSEKEHALNACFDVFVSRMSRLAAARGSKERNGVVQRVERVCGDVGGWSRGAERRGVRCFFAVVTRSYTVMYGTVRCGGALRRAVRCVGPWARGTKDPCL